MLRNNHRGPRPNKYDPKLECELEFSSSPKSDSLQRVLLSPKEAKVFHRVRRWAGLKTFTGEEEEEEEEGSRERRMRDNLRRYCSWAAHAHCNIWVGATPDLCHSNPRSNAL